MTLQNGQVGDCMKLLDGYWPRFLAQHVPLAARPPKARWRRAEENPPPADKPAPPPRTGFMDKVKNMLPEKLRW